MSLEQLERLTDIYRNLVENEQIHGTVTIKCKDIRFLLDLIDRMVLHGDGNGGVK